MTTWHALRAHTVTACGPASPIVAGAPLFPGYVDALATFGAGTFDDFLTILPPQLLQTWSDRMGGLLAPERMPAALRDLVIFADDIDGRMYCFDDGGLVVVDGFDDVRKDDLATELARALTYGGRRRSWFRPYGTYTLAHAEAMLEGASEELDAWVKLLDDDDDDARLLESRGSAREIHLPAMDAVLSLQVVGSRCSLRLHLPRGADAPAELLALNAPPPWRSLVAGAAVKVIGHDIEKK